MPRPLEKAQEGGLERAGEGCPGNGPIPHSPREGLELFGELIYSCFHWVRVQNFTYTLFSNFVSQQHMLKNEFEKEKPWALLGISRKKYESARMWKKTKLTRKEFDELISSLPAEFFKEMQYIADGERLVESIFGKLNGSE